MASGGTYALWRAEFGGISVLLIDAWLQEEKPISPSRGGSGPDAQLRDMLRACMPAPAAEVSSLGEEPRPWFFHPSQLPRAGSLSPQRGLLLSPNPHLDIIGLDPGVHGQNQVHEPRQKDFWKSVFIVSDAFEISTLTSLSWLERTKTVWISLNAGDNVLRVNWLCHRLPEQGPT